jgi:hypothetical protein
MQGSKDAMHDFNSPQTGKKTPFPIAFICSKSRRIPASASTNQGPEKGDLIPLRGRMDGGPEGSRIARQGSYLTECIHQLVLESQLRYKIVNFLFTFTNQNMKLTVLCGC